MTCQSRSNQEYGSLLVIQQCTLLSAHILKARSAKMTYSALKNEKSFGRFPLLKAITGSHSSRGQLFIGMTCQPTYQFFPPMHSSAVLFARWSMSLPKHQFLFLPFNYTNTLFTMYKLISPPPPPPFSMLLFQLTPSNTWFTRTRLMSWHKLSLVGDASNSLW